MQGLDLIIKYFVGTELGVANFLQRHFDWSSNCLWYEEIPNARDPKKTLFVLGGKDSIIDATVSHPCILTPLLNHTDCILSARTALPHFTWNPEGSALRPRRAPRASAPVDITCP